MKYKYILLLVIILLLVVEISCNNISAKRVIFKKQLGTYILDVSKTSLGNYARDSDVYKRLCITFKEDSSFIMNMKVPFMYDSIGKWIAGDGSPYISNMFFYNKFNYKNTGTGEQFYSPYLSGSDTVFLINSTTPQKDHDPIPEIYFKKVSPR